MHLSCARIPVSLFFSGKHRTNLLACLRRYSRERAPRSLGENSIHYSFASLLGLRPRMRRGTTRESDKVGDGSLEVPFVVLQDLRPNIFPDPLAPNSLSLTLCKGPRLGRYLAGCMTSVARSIGNSPAAYVRLARIRISSRTVFSVKG